MVATSRLACIRLAVLLLLDQLFNLSFLLRQREDFILNSGKENGLVILEILQVLNIISPQVLDSFDFTLLSFYGLQDDLLLLHVFKYIFTADLRHKTSAYRPLLPATLIVSRVVRENANSMRAPKKGHKEKKRSSCVTRCVTRSLFGHEHNSAELDSAFETLEIVQNLENLLRYVVRRPLTKNESL